jgi:hypothetical protein
MFLYRRQGPKKRPKSGTPRKGRSPQKGLPNSARDLLPLIQPATKALAQMLAGHTGASGQLGHARAVLAQTERLVSERAHNRLNPAEREEFFEQVARLKLTLSDAESEAEFQAAEEQTPTPAPVPVDRERLKAMAMSLTTSSAPADSHAASGGERGDDGRPQARDGDSPSSIPSASDAEQGTDEIDAAVRNGSTRSGDPSQLRLPRDTAEKLTLQPGSASVDSSGRRRKPKLNAAAQSRTSSGSATKPEVKSGVAGDVAARPDAAGKANKVASGQKLPKGWIIDDEGFVVPGPG